MIHQHQQQQQRDLYYARQQQQHDRCSNNSRHNMNMNANVAYNINSPAPTSRQQSPSSYNERSHSSSIQTTQSSSMQTTQPPPIFSARGVLKWPLPLIIISVQQYRKYHKESKVLGANCGITSSGLRILFNTENNASGGHGSGSSLAGDVGAGGGISAFSSQQTQSATVGDNSSVAAGRSSSVDGSSGGSGGGGGGYGGLTGLMGRVLGAGSSSTATGGGGVNLSSEFYLL